MPAKVTSIAAGEAHTLALTGDGEVFSWGRGTFGRLGTGMEEDEFVPVPVAVFGERATAKPKFVAVAAGAYHSLALDDEGSVWSWGYNIYGQLGCAGENTAFPCIVKHFQELGSPDSLADESNPGAPLKISGIKAGGMMSFAIDSLGTLWMWGNCPQPTAASSGEFSLERSAIPQPVWDLHGHSVVKVACGSEHVVAAVSAGEMYEAGNLMLYAWGNNNHGQLGLGDRESRPRPAVISMFNEKSSWEVYDIACGAWHTAILTHQKSYNLELESKCWTFGLGENGQLGNRTATSTCLPEPVDGLPHDAFLISLDCGLFHTVVVSSDGEVWCWGMMKGLGLCPEARLNGGNDAGDDALMPTRIQSPETNGFKFMGAVQVASGAAHTVLIAGDGYRMWAWGRGRNGVLGNGKTTDSYAPSVVVWQPQGGNFLEIERNETRATPSVANEIELLQGRLNTMARYANILHISIFRKPLDEQALLRRFDGSSASSATFDMWRDIDETMEAADGDELARMQAFYRNMLAAIEDKMLKRRVREMVGEILGSPSAAGRRHN